MVSIIIVNFNGLAHTRNALRSILRHSPTSEAIVVDNCSSDGSASALRSEFPSMVIHAAPRNGGFAFGCNRGAELAKAKYLFFMNNDALLTEDTPSILASYLDANPSCVAVGPRLLNLDGSFQLSLGLEPSISGEWSTRRWQRISKHSPEQLSSMIDRRYAKKMVDWITGAALMMRKDVFTEIGGFDESYFMYFEDVDLCRRIRNAGHEVRYNPETSMIHLVGQSANKEKTRVSREYRASQLRYYRKHHSGIAVGLLRLYLVLKSLA